MTIVDLTAISLILFWVTWRAIGLVVALACAMVLFIAISSIWRFHLPGWELLSHLVRR